MKHRISGEVIFTSLFVYPFNYLGDLVQFCQKACFIHYILKALGIFDLFSGTLHFLGLRLGTRSLVFELVPSVDLELYSRGIL